MKKILIIIAFIILSITVKAQTDWEIWTTFNVSGNISDKFKIALEGEDRYGHKTDNIKYFHYDIGLIYKISKKFSTGLFYREIYVNSKDFSTRLPQPHIDIFYKEPIGFKFRTRIEYQMFKVLDHQFRLRLRPGWQFSFWKNYNPFIQSELFINQKYVLTRNRFSTGITMKFGKIQIQPNYTLESNNKEIWSNRSIVWFNTKFKF